MTEPQIPGPVLPHGSIVGRAASVWADGPDAGIDPDLRNLDTLMATFTPTVNTVVWSGLDGPVVLQPRSVSGVFIDGVLHLHRIPAPDPPGTPGIDGVMASVGDDIEPSGWGYQLTWSGAEASRMPKPKPFPISAGETINLADVITESLPDIDPAVLNHLLLAAEETLLARDETVALRDEVGVISGLTGEDAAVATLVETPGSDTSAALSGAIVAAKPVIDVRDYGAVGDGVTDDSLAIRAAATAATGGVLQFTAGKTYRVSRVSENVPYALAISAGQAWHGNGATIKLDDGALPHTSVVKVDGDGTLITGLTIDGNRSGQTEETQHQRHGIHITTVTDTRITDCTIINCAGDGVLIYRDGDRATISGTTITGSRRSGIALVGDSHEVSITNCRIYGTDATPIDGEVENVGDGYATDLHVQGCYLEAPAGEYALTAMTTNPATRNLRWIVTGNTIRGGLSLLRSTGLRIANNTIEALGSTGVSAAIIADLSTDATITGNRITSDARGIQAQFILTVQPVNLTISDNVIDSAGIGIYLGGPRRALVHNNICTGRGAAANPGIYVYATTPTQDVHLSGNLVLNYAMNGIQVGTFGANTIDGLTVQDNTFRDTQGTVTQLRGVRLEGVAAQFTRTRVSGNIAAAGTVSPFSDGTTGIILSEGFYGKVSVPRPALTYSRTGETVREAGIRTALVALGLVTDSTTA